MKAMQTATAGSVEEYLARSYRPDREYIDGTILERHLGDRDHSEVQTEIATYLNSRRKQLGIRVFVEQRIQVAPSRFRIPDICVTVGPRPQELVLTRPPFVCIEILSKDDRPSDTRERVEDYLAFGMTHVWVVDPRTRKAWGHTAEGGGEVTSGVLGTTDPKIVVPLDEIFAALED